MEESQGSDGGDVDGQTTPEPIVPTDHDEYLAWTLGGDLLSLLKRGSPKPDFAESLAESPTSPGGIAQRLEQLE